jgi:hypothetical protein
MIGKLADCGSVGPTYAASNGLRSATDRSEKSSFWQIPKHQVSAIYAACSTSSDKCKMPVARHS